MRSTIETDARSAQSEFGELLVTLHDDSDDWRSVVLQLVEVAGIATLIIGMIWFPALAAVHVNSFVRGGPGARDVVEATTRFGAAAGAPFSFIGVGGLLISSVSYVKQRKSEQLARTHHDMPVVFLAPRLVWDFAGVPAGIFTPNNLRLCMAIRNVSDVAAIQVFVDIHDLSFDAGETSHSCTPRSKAQERNVAISTIPAPSGRMAGRFWFGRLLAYINLRSRPFDAVREKPVPVPLGESRIRLDYLTKSEVGNENKAMPGYAILSEIPLDQWAELIDAIVTRGADAERPSLTMSCSVGFTTIRGARFRSTAKAIWSPKHCRKVESHDLRDSTKQRDFLDKLWQCPSEYMKLVREIKPLSPMFS